MSTCPSLSTTVYNVYMVCQQLSNFFNHISRSWRDFGKILSTLLSNCWRFDKTSRSKIAKKVSATFNLTYFAICLTKGTYITQSPFFGSQKMETIRCYIFTRTLFLSCFLKENLSPKKGNVKKQCLIFMGQSIWQRHKSGIYRISNRSQTDLMTWMLPNRFIESQTNSTIIHHPSSLSNANLVSFSFAPEEVLWAMMHLYSVSALQSNSLVFSNERSFFLKTCWANEQRWVGCDGFKHLQHLGGNNMSLLP